MITAAALTYLGTHSTVQEKVAEYLFLSLLLLEGASSSISVDVARSDIDAFGHDLIIRSGTDFRLVQMKSRGGGIDGDGDWYVHTSLLSNPNGAVICGRLLSSPVAATTPHLLIRHGAEELRVRFKLLNSALFNPADRSRLPIKPSKTRVYEREFVDITTDLLLLFRAAGFWTMPVRSYPRS
jgi:hypothetical protein